MAEPTKHCPGCGRTKPARHWHRDRHRPDGLHSRCAACRRAGNAAATTRWRTRNPGYQAAYDAAYRDDKNAADRARYHADPETARAVQREKAARFRARHRARLNAQKRADYAQDRRGA